MSAIMQSGVLTLEIWSMRVQFVSCVSNFQRMSNTVTFCSKNITIEFINVK